MCYCDIIDFIIQTDLRFDKPLALRIMRNAWPALCYSHVFKSRVLYSSIPLPSSPPSVLEDGDCFPRHWQLCSHDISVAQDIRIQS